MPTLRDIKGHIQSVGSIAKVTKAMEMVSAAQSHRLEARVRNTYPFAARSWEVLDHLAGAADETVRRHPMFSGHPRVERLGVVLFTSDRGMVGAYDMNVIAAANQFLRQRGLPADFVTIGRMGREQMLHQGHAIHADLTLDDRADLVAITPIAELVLDGFVDGAFQEVVIAYTQFHQGARLKPIVEPLLPIRATGALERREYLYEPSPEELLRELLPRMIRFRLYQAFLEAQAAEHTARMLAMHQATRNAQDITSQLTLGYNRARQQAITSELTDILGGRMALSRGRSKAP
jgi:F-type H+-transporting ATPase subunit gamma